MKIEFARLPKAVNFLFVVIIALLFQSCGYRLYRSNEKVNLFGHRKTKYIDSIMTSNYVAPKQLPGKLYVYVDDLYNKSLYMEYNKEFYPQIKNIWPVTYNNDSILSPVLRELKRANMFKEVYSVNSIDSLNLKKEDCFVRIVPKPGYSHIRSFVEGWRVFTFPVPFIGVIVAWAYPWSYLFLKNKPIYTPYTVKLYNSSGILLAEKNLIDTIKIKAQAFAWTIMAPSEKLQKTAVKYISKQTANFCISNLKSIESNYENIDNYEMQNSGFLKGIYKEQIDFNLFVANNYEKWGFAAYEYQTAWSDYTSKTPNFKGAFEYRVKVMNTAVLLAKLNNDNNLANEIRENYLKEEINITAQHKKAYYDLLDRRQENLQMLTNVLQGVNIALQAQNSAVPVSDYSQSLQQVYNYNSQSNNGSNTNNQSSSKNTKNSNQNSGATGSVEFVRSQIYSLECSFVKVTFYDNTKGTAISTVNWFGVPPGNYSWMAQEFDGETATIPCGRSWTGTINVVANQSTRKYLDNSNASIVQPNGGANNSNQNAVNNKASNRGESSPNNSNQNTNNESSNNINEQSGNSSNNVGPTAQTMCMEIYDKKWGGSCNSQSSYSFRIKNNCNESIDMKYCVQNSNGTWSCGMMSNTKPGGNTSFFNCNSTGKVMYWGRKAGDYKIKFPATDENGNKY